MIRAGQTLPVAEGQETASRHISVFQGERRQSKMLCLEASAPLDQEQMYEAPVAWWDRKASIHLKLHLTNQRNPKMTLKMLNSRSNRR